MIDTMSNSSFARMQKMIEAQEERIKELYEAWGKAVHEADEIAESYDILNGAWATDLAKLKNANERLKRCDDYVRGVCSLCIKTCHSDTGQEISFRDGCKDFVPVWDAPRSKS